MTSTGLAPAPIHATYPCGPVELKLAFDDPTLHEALHGLLSQYDAPWPAPSPSIHIAIERGAAQVETSKPAGSHFRSWCLKADRQDARITSLGNAGVWMELDLAEGQARIVVPDHPDRQLVVEEIEQQLILLLARAWAREGWTPLHAGSLIPPGETRCVLVCAPSGVGKTTFIAALLRRGWRTLGDDKTLLRKENGVIVARALARRFHLHPTSSRWFPEIGNCNDWPRYSRWTDKRVVRIEELWPGRLLDCATPAAVVQLERIETGLIIEPLNQFATLNTLLRQVALPTDAEYARPLVSCIAATTANLKSARIKIGNEAFSDFSTAVRLDETLRGLLA